VPDDADEPGTGADEPGTLRALLRRIALVGSPLAVGTVLLFYFGWVRTRTQFQELGFDTSVVDLTTTDYLLKSVNVLFLPVVVALLLALGLVALHLRIFPVDGRGKGVPGWFGWVGRAWFGWIVLGAMLYFGVPATDGVVIPFALTAAALTFLYTDHLRHQFDPTRARSAVMRTVVVLVALCSVFWATERLARAAGHLYAVQALVDHTNLPPAIVYSKDDLGIIGQDVVVTPVGDSAAAYRFRYTGLRVLLRSEERYYLLALNPSAPAKGRLIVLVESDTLRFEVGG
jgi:hypothetical protein